METALFFSTIWRPGDIIIIFYTYFPSFFPKLFKSDYLSIFQKSTNYIMAIGVQLTNYLVKVQTTEY